MTLALIAGTGGLPPRLAGALLQQGRVPVICEMRGFPSAITGEFTRIPFRIETLGTFLASLTALGVSEVCMAGAMQRPDVDPSAIDAATAPLVPRLIAAMAKGDDGTLREIIAVFEEQGFAVIGAHQIAPELLPPAGIHTKIAPPDLMQDLAVAKRALVEMGQSDQGQAMLVKDGAVIAREDARGTDAMLQDHCAGPETDKGLGDPLDVFGDLIAGAADWLSGQDPDALPAAGAFLYKGPKPEQILLADMPLIGPSTAHKAADAGLAGIVVPHGGVMVLDLPQVVSVLDGRGLYLWVHP